MKKTKPTSPKPTGPTGTVTLTQAARLLGMGRDTVQAHIDAGTIPAKRLGRRILISQEWLDNWFERLPDAKKQ